MNSAGYTPEEPIAAIATALAPAALGIVRCSGKGVIELLAPLFSRPKALLSAEGNTIVYGWLTEPATGQEAVGRRIDQVLVAERKSLSLIVRCCSSSSQSYLSLKMGIY